LFIHRRQALKIGWLINLIGRRLSSKIDYFNSFIVPLLQAIQRFSQVSLAKVAPSK
jgi:hypothetical protein